MDTYKVHIGHVLRFFKDRDFGFIEDENGESYFFFRNKEELKKKKQAGLIPFVHCFVVGDRVSYKLRASKRHEAKFEAYDVEFISNENKELLISEFQNDSILEGYIKIINGGKFFVHHKMTQLDLPISISVWEKDVNQFYGNLENRLVSFKLKLLPKNNKIKAILIDRQFIPEYYELMSHYSNQTPLPALITRKNRYGLLASICDQKISGFVNFLSKTITIDEKKLNQIQKGDIVDVLIRYPLRDDNRQVLLSLV